MHPEAEEVHCRSRCWSIAKMLLALGCCLPAGNCLQMWRFHSPVRIDPRAPYLRWPDHNSDPAADPPGSVRYPVPPYCPPACCTRQHPSRVQWSWLPLLHICRTCRTCSYLLLSSPNGLDAFSNEKSCTAPCKKEITGLRISRQRTLSTPAFTCRY